MVIGSAIQHPRTFSQELRQHFKFIFTDTRGFAPLDTPVDLSKITLDIFLEDVEKIRRILDLPKICVLGHSIHGLLALEYARKYPQHTSHVIVIGTLPCGSRKNLKASRQHWKNNASDERKEIMKRKLEKQNIQALSKMSASEKFIKHFINNGPLYWYDPTYDCTWLWEGIELDAKIGGHLNGVMFKVYDIAKGSGKINRPVFVAMGKHDYMVPHFQWDTEIEKLPKISYNLFEKSGHTPQLEEPAQFNKRLIDWIKNQ